MTSYEFSLQPPQYWESICAQHDSLFHTFTWQALLNNAFAADAIYVFEPTNGAATILHVFKASIFRVAYVAFPVGGMVNGQPVDNRLVRAICEAELPLRIDMLRVRSSPFPTVQTLSVPSTVVPETAVLHLQDWRLNALPATVRRNIKKAQRSGVIVEPPRNSVATRLHQLYVDTVHRHAGSLRYNQRYFVALLKLAERHPAVSCTTARLNEKVIGFVVVTYHNRMAIYLHGGIDRRYQSYRPADLLFADAIERAQNAGMTCFNMLQSPADQPSLVRFKEKWGGVTRDHHTYDIPIKPFPAAIFRMAEHGYRLLHRIRT